MEKLILFAIFGGAAFLAYWALVRIRWQIQARWSHGIRSKAVVVGWILLVTALSIGFFLVFDARNGAIVGYLAVSSVVLAGYELWWNHRDNLEAAERNRERSEVKRQQLATGEGWSKSDVLDRFRTTLYYREGARGQVTSGWRCAVCGKNLYRYQDASLDHIKPRSKYPELLMTEANLQVLCRPCNSTKSAYDGEDWKIVTRKRRRVIRKAEKAKRQQTGPYRLMSIRCPIWTTTTNRPSFRIGTREPRVMATVPITIFCCFCFIFDSMPPQTVNVCALAGRSCGSTF